MAYLTIPSVTRNRTISASWRSSQAERDLLAGHGTPDTHLKAAA